MAGDCNGIVTVAGKHSVKESFIGKFTDVGSTCARSASERQQHSVKVLKPECLSDETPSTLRGNIPSAVPVVSKHPKVTVYIPKEIFHMAWKALSPGLAIATGWHRLDLGGQWGQGSTAAVCTTALGGVVVQTNQASTNSLH